MSALVIETARLTLRPLHTGDADQFLRLAGDWDVACMPSDIPHPLTPGQAVEWLRPELGDVRLGIVFRGTLAGSVGYFQRETGVAELGFWMGRRYWGLGLATEAASSVVRYGFTNGIDQFSSAHFVENHRSGRVLEKLGFQPAGVASIWCAARGVDVEAIALSLTRDGAEAQIGPLSTPVRSRPVGWAGRLGRWFNGGVRP